MNDEWTPVLLDDPAPPEPNAAVLESVVRRGRQRLRRRRASFGASVVTLVVVLGLVSLVAVSNSGDGRRTRVVTEPSTAPTPSTTRLDDAPVWYDVKGLHRGTTLIQTPVKLLSGDSDGMKPGALTLVRSGALYLDPSNGDVWFHPWDGKPRIVGRNSAAGPGGDPNGDTAAWFEGSVYDSSSQPELVIYDTAAGREISRTNETSGAGLLGGDHKPTGNTFLQVSAERVLWEGAMGGRFSHDVRTGQTSTLTNSTILDAHDRLEVRGPWVLRVPGQPDENHEDFEPRARFSPSGSYVLTVQDPHAAAIVDTKTGRVWKAITGYPWNAWSYDDIAMIDSENALHACDPAARKCKRLRAERPFLMPTN